MIDLGGCVVMGGYVVMEQKTGIRNADLGIIFIAPSLLHE